MKSVFFGVSPRLYTARNPRSLGFEETPVGFDNGRSSSCAINGQNRFIEVHVGEISDTLNFRQGNLVQLDLRFTDKANRGKIADGKNPVVAYNDDSVAIVLADQNDKVKYAAARVDTNADANPPFQFTEFPPTGSTFPSVALNKAGVVLEVHQTGNNLSYRRGKLAGTTLTWSGVNLLVNNGAHPSVAINNQGSVVVVFERSGKLSCLTGSFDPSQTAITAPIVFNRPASAYADTGSQPSVALTDAGEVFATHTSGSSLYQVVGLLAGTKITWQDFLVPGQTAYRYDDGIVAHVATNGKVAIQLFYLNSGGFKLFGNAALVFDRSRWMGDHRDQLKDKTLRQIAIPGSHDAGAFADNIARTQDLSILQQLSSGVRYFDLRPLYSGDLKTIDPAKITTYHRIDVNVLNPDFPGPSFPGLVASIRTFMQSHKELVILRVSQFKNFNQQVFDALAGVFLGDSKGTTGLAKWLFPLQSDGKRLADRSLGDFLKPNQGTVLVVFDVDGPNTAPAARPKDYITDAYRRKGLYKYRDWYARDPAAGDLTVFDIFSNTNVFDTMALNSAASDSKYAIPPGGTPLPIGQLNKFDWFDGLCQKDDRDPNKRSNVQCDLFLLSWTLTPSIPMTERRPLERTAFAGAESANRNLTSYLAIPKYQGANAKKLSMNVLYTDAVEFSRSVDLALIRNGIG
jgi:hypothetical protein